MGSSCYAYVYHDGAVASVLQESRCLGYWILCCYVSYDVVKVSR